MEQETLFRRQSQREPDSGFDVSHSGRMNLGTANQRKSKLHGENECAGISRRTVELNTLQ
jgi:hypothetical protein